VFVNTIHDFIKIIGIVKFGCQHEIGKEGNMYKTEKCFSMSVLSYHD